MITKYKLIISKISTSAGIIITYDGDLMLEFKREIELDEKQYDWLFTRFPIYKSGMQELIQDGKGAIQFSIIPEDVSFDAFWRKYNYKVGAKAKTEALWNKLKESEKIQALEAIKKYENYLQRHNVAKVYPERFISQRRWENNF